MLLRSAALVFLLFALPANASAQHVCEGNGLAPLSIAVSPAYLGGTLTIDIEAPGAPGGVVALAKANDVGPVFHPLIGWTCLDVFAPGLQILTLPLDAAGEIHLSVALPPEVAFVSAPPFYLAPALPTPAGIALGKTVPIYFTFHDSWAPAGSLPIELAFLQATPLGDGPLESRIDVFLSGGGDGSVVDPGSKARTWIYRPLKRVFTPGPNMSVARSSHTQTKLADGRVLIAGGADALGVCTTSAEIYDHDTGTLSPAASMSSPRAGHMAALLQDGRVLVTGGVSDYQIAATSLTAVLDTAQSTAEIYDPATDTWTLVADVMQSGRIDHGQILWPDGRVLVLLGVSGGALTLGGAETAAFTATCDWFDPVTETFDPAPSAAIGGAGFALGRLGSGELLIAAGMQSDDTNTTVASARIAKFDGTSWNAPFASGPPAVPYSVHGRGAYPTLGILPDGRAMIAGGFGDAAGVLDFLEGNAFCQATDMLDADAFGVCGEALADIGTGVGQPGAPSPRGGHAMVQLFDGTFLVVGGINGSSSTPVGSWALADAFIYAP